MTDRIQKLTMGLRYQGTLFPKAKPAIDAVISSPKSMNTLADILEKCTAK